VTSANNRLIYLERVKGIEPSSKAWEAGLSLCNFKPLRDTLLNCHDFGLPVSPSVFWRLPRRVSHFVTWARARVATAGLR
jgi:hypothetical protein